MTSNEELLCTICYTSEFYEETSVKLTSCGHIFHTECILELLKHKWATLRITFAFMSCPSCKKQIEVNDQDNAAISN